MTTPTPDHSRQQPSPHIDNGIGQQPLPGSGLQRLWAPYRSAYLTNPDRKKVASENKDPFLELPQKSDEDGLIVARGTHVYCALNLYPYNPGHMMVIPYRQVADYTELTDDETWEMAHFTKTAMRVLRATSQPDAINVGMNLGKASGGSIPIHLHQHIVPRWVGDTNFITVTAGTKVLPQLLRDTRKLLADAWAEKHDTITPESDPATPKE